MPILLIIPLMVRTPYGAGRRDYGYVTALGPKAAETRMVAETFG